MEQIEIKKLGINGEGIGYIRNKVCFIDHALPGEIVEVYIDTEQKRFMKGHIHRFIKTSSARQNVTCPDYENCQGCALLHMKYEDQLVAKREMIKEALEKYTSLKASDYVIKPVMEAEHPTHYRQYVGFPIAYEDHKISIGIYQRSSKTFTCMRHCEMQDPLINEAIKKIEAILNRYKCHDYDDKFKTGLRFIMIKNVQGALQVVFVTGKDGIKKEVTREIEKIPSVKSLYYTINTTRYQDFDLQGYKRIYGESALSYLYQNEPYRLSVKSDLMIHPAMYEEEIALVQELFAPGDTVLSLKCQSGLLELQLDEQLVFGIDQNKSNIEDALFNKEALNKESVSFEYGDPDKVLPRYLKRRHFDGLILRLDHEGISAAMLEAINKARLDTIVISCDLPSTLAKAIAALADLYDVDLIAPFDYEPYTPKVRTIACLIKK